MGPIALFDKSFIQGLSVDESVWFDQFFISNICPIFYVETLSNLGKDFSGDKSAEGMVSSIANKVPEMHSSPCMHHSELCLGNLLGRPVSMKIQIPMAGGYPVKVKGKAGVVFRESPEAKAFSRWQNQRFHELERDFAFSWRVMLERIDLKATAKNLKSLGYDPRSCKSHSDVASLAKSIVDASGHDYQKICALCAFQEYDREKQDAIVAAWRKSGCPSLRRYAPYAAHVLEVDLFFQIGLASSLISTDRPSNRVDIAYLYYLPFAHVFISSDKLHRVCAQVLWPQGAFAWGPDLKADLKRINEHYSSIPEDERAKGLTSLVTGPPDLPGSLVVLLWDQWAPRWRERSSKPVATTAIQDEALVKELNQFADAPPLEGAEAAEAIGEHASLTLQRYVRAHKGSWWQIPESVAKRESGAG